jgi:hypothetical protein
MSFWFMDSTGQSGDNADTEGGGSPDLSVPLMAGPMGGDLGSYEDTSGSTETLPSIYPLSTPGAASGPSAAPTSGAVTGPAGAGGAGTTSATTPSLGIPLMAGPGGIAGLIAAILGGGSSTALPGGVGAKGGAIAGAGGGELGNFLTSIIGPEAGINPSAAGNLGSTIGGAAGAIAGLPFGGLLGVGAGSALGDLLGGLIGGWAGGGLPEMSKPQSYVDALKASGNPVEALLGRYIQQHGINMGYDLSEGGGTPFKPREAGDLLELLSGDKLPLQEGGTLAPFGGELGYQNPVSLSGFKSLGALQAMFPEFQDLSTAQISQIMPEISRLIAQRGGLKAAAPGVENLATKLYQAETY